MPSSGFGGELQLGTCPSSEGLPEGSGELSCCEFFGKINKGFLEGVLRRGGFQKVLRTPFWRVQLSRRVPYSAMQLDVAFLQRLNTALALTQA